MKEKFKKERRKRWLGKNNPRWKGGVRKHTKGYIQILKPSHPRADSNGYVKRSYLVIEKFIGRVLKFEEVVHHINGIKDDDRLKNLKLFPNTAEHTRFHHAQPQQKHTNQFSHNILLSDV